MDDNATVTAGAPPGAFEDAVERWWQDHFPGSPLAQVTQAWNHTFAAKEDLKQRLNLLARGGH